MIRIVIILLLLVLVVWLVVRLQGDAYAKFKAGAGEVMGEIVKKETRIDNPKTNHKEEILIYRYSVGGQEYTAEERVEYEDLWMEARAGMELKIYYDKKNPAKAYPAALLDRRLDIAGK